MITELKIKLIFLRLLKRNPSSDELVYADTLSSEQAIIDNITTGDEYHNLNDDIQNRLSYDVVNEQIVIDSVTTNRNTFVIGSEHLEIQASSQYNITRTNSYHEGFSKVELFSLCDVRFFTLDYETSAEFSENTHLLDTRKCTLIHSGTISFDVNETMIKPKIQFVSEKRCLQNFPSCFMQTFSITSDQTGILPIFHCFQKSSQMKRKFETFVPFNSEHSNAFYLTVADNNIDSTHVVFFKNDMEVSHRGIQATTTDGQTILNTFHINVDKEVMIQFHIFSFIAQQGSSTSHHGRSILAGLINTSPETVIREHEERWMMSWKRNVNTVYKTHITNTDVAELSKFMAILKYGLFTLYACPMKDDLINMLPLLNLTNQQKTKRVLDVFLHESNHTERSQLAMLYGRQGSYFKHKTSSTSSDYDVAVIKAEELNHRFIKYIFKTALVNIAIWNYFRTTKDKTWFTLTGFPAMKRNADFLCDFVDDDGHIKSVRSMNDYDQDNNSYTNTVVHLALSYTNQGIYELNYKDDTNIESREKVLKTSLIPFETVPTDEKVVIVESNALHVFVEKLNGLYTYVFYEDSLKHKRIGYQFGGKNGFFVDLRQNVKTIYIDKSVYAFPITFFEYKNTLLPPGITLTPQGNLSGGLGENVVQEIQLLHQVGNRVVIDQSIHSTISYRYSGSIYKSSYLHVDFDTSFGENAFHINTNISPSGIPLTNFSKVVRLHDNVDWSQEFETNETLLLFSDTNEFEETLAKTNKLSDINDIIKDTIQFYRTKVSNTAENSQMDSVAQSYLAQHEADYGSKKNAITSFFNNTVDTINLFDRSSLFPVVFAVVSNLCGIHVTGTILQSRYVTTDYGLQMKRRNVFPKCIKSVTIHGLLNALQNDLVMNTLYNDNPLLSVLNHKEVQFILKESSCVIRVILSEQLDDDEYTYEMYFKKEGVTLPDPQSNVCEAEFSFELPNEDQSTDYEITTLEGIEFHIDVLHETNIVNQHSEVFITILDNVTDIQSQPPYMRSIIEYPDDNSDNKVFLKLQELVTLENTTWRSINHFTVSIEYDARFISNPEFIADPDSEWTMDMYGTEQGNTLRLEFHKDISSTIIRNIGTLSFTMDLVYISILSNAYIPLSGETTVTLSDATQLKRPLRINQNAFAPTVYKQSRRHGFVYETYQLTPVETHFLDSYLTQVEFVGDVYGIQPIPSIQQSINNLVQDTTVIEQIYASELNTIVRMSTNEFVGKGPNTYNHLLRDPGETNGTEYQPCSLLSSISNIEEIHLANTFTLVRTTDSIFGIGLNIDHNLGDSTHTVEEGHEHTTSLIRCDLFDSILVPYQPENLLRIGVLFDTALDRDVSFTIIYDSVMNKVFVIGCNPVFEYATSLGGGVYTANELVELTIVNDFLVEDENSIYTVKNMDLGDHCFRFELENQSTQQTEWWGFGQNRYGSLGVVRDPNDSIETPMKYEKMTRLTMIESIRFGKYFDPTYTGLSVFHPEKFYLAPSDGCTNNHHLVVTDTLTKELFVLGKMNAQNEYTEWTEYTSITLSHPTYIKPITNGFLVGNHG